MNEENVEDSSETIVKQFCNLLCSISNVSKQASSPILLKSEVSLYCYYYSL